MALTPGTRLGVYEVIAHIGEGGMGQVYRARDTKLNRDVALKILPDSFATDPERLARLTREAQTLASLNHPHIAHIHGLEESGGVRAIVMELVEGQDLSQRIGRRAIALDDALPIAKQIARALEAAHEQGIIHRDLKPANIKVREDGTVKVLDFGLAKVLEPTPRSSPSTSMSPTITTPAMTQAGMILGTAAYMAPEQAKGRAADRRSDVWAFGCVLFEMLTGKRAFEGEDVGDTLAAVLRGEPNWAALPPETPLALRKLIRGCLQKDRTQRIADISTAYFLLSDPAAFDSVAPAMPRALPFWQRAWPWASTGALMLALMLAVWAAWWPAPQHEQLLRRSVELGADASLVTNFSAAAGSAAVLSPDGRVLAFVARKAAGEASQLYVRRLDQLEAAPLAGTEGSRNPFFSPDGQSIAFFAGGKLKRVAATGGAVVTLCDVPFDRGGTWSEDGSILFASSGPPPGLRRVSSAGGVAEALTTPDPAAGEFAGWPQALPGGEAVLFTVFPRLPSFADAILAANLVVQRLPGGPRKIVHRGGNYGRYLPSGHLVYVREGTLFAAPFDVDRLETTGPPVPAVEGVKQGEGGAQFTFSSRGTLVFVPGQYGAGVPIQWMDAEGNLTPLRAVAADCRGLRFSPDGQRLAIWIRQGAHQDMWIYEWERDALTRMASDAGYDGTWTPDGRRIAFASSSADKATPNLYWQRADGSGVAERLTESPNWQYPTSWHPSGKFLAFSERQPQGQSDIMILPLEGDDVSGWTPGKPSVFLDTSFHESSPAFSPDGRWLAYQSRESGTDEVYVRPFPGPGSRSLVSTAGGQSPVWSRNGKEVFYWSGDRSGEQIWVASYAVDGDSFRAEKPRAWSPVRIPRRAGNPRFDLHPDGKRFAVLNAAEETEVRRVVFITNFFDELRRIAPSATR